MLRSVTVTNPKGEALKMELEYPERTGLLVAKVEGLSPPKANINGYEIATEDGMRYTSARAESRNIVLSLIFWSRDKTSPYGELSIEDARHLTYQYFPLKKKIELVFTNDTGSYHIDGYVESNEVSIFSTEEYAQISVICPNPYFYTPGEEKTVFSGIQPMFEFPLIANYEPPDGSIQFGEIWLDSTAIFNYRGTVDTGLTITIHAFGKAENIMLYNVDTKEWFRIDTSRIEKITGKPFDKGDDIIISTVKNNRYCQLLRKGVYTNIISAISMDSDWFQISGGNNGFMFDASSGKNNLSVTFSYKNAYVGV